MTDPSEARLVGDLSPSDRCAACGQPAEELIDGCCLLCGHRIEQGDVTAEDRTPYARARETGGRAWRLMCGWVYGAGKQRLMHLGLSRPSPASRRFARINLTLFAVAVMVSVFANTGWHVVTQGPGTMASTPSPAGKGWWHCLTVSRPTEQSFADQVLATDLWWNVPLTMLAAVAALLMTLLAGLVLLWLTGAGSQRAAQGERDAGPRLRCAVHYSSAWVHFAALAALVIAFRPLAMVFQVAGWGAIPSVAAFDVPAVLLSLVGVLLWWFWLIRLAETAPREERRSVSRFFVVWVPLLVIAVTAGGTYGLYAGTRRLAVALNLIW